MTWLVLARQPWREPIGRTAFLANRTLDARIEAEFTVAE